MKTKVMRGEEALDFVKDGDSIVTSMGGAIGDPHYVVKCLEDRYMERNSPGGLTLYSGCGHASDHRFAHPGFLKRIVGSHPGPCAPIMAMVENNEIEAYGLPQGILQQLYRCSAAKQAGLLSKIGIGTYVDPRMEGGKLNEAAKEDISRLVEMDGEEWIFYKSFPIDIAILRATTADENGNLTIEEEALKVEILETAMAARATGGKVIAQVKRIAANGTLKAKDVVVPGELVDAVVLTEEPETYHKQTGGTYYSPYLSGELRMPAGAVAKPAETLEAVDVVCRRAVYELFPGAVVNVGVGIGAGVSNVAAVEGIVDKITFTIELGSFGGTPATMYNFGSTINATAYISHPSMFDFYHCGGLDLAFLGSAQIDKDGNVNVSKFGEYKSGRAQGGFIDISQSSKKVVFCTYFKAQGLKTEIADGKLHILREGASPKFVDKVEQITFSGAMAVKSGKEVVYVTERGVFQLTPEGVTLTEIAPGVDLQKDILDQMGFQPVVSKDLKVMDERIFVPGRMGCFDED
jgi:propionate CoA-transferase